MFLALGRLTDYKRIDLLLRLWERVRHVVGGTAGDRRATARSGPASRPWPGPDVVVTGRVSEEEKHRLLCSAWLLLHPAMIEGWGIVIAEAAIRGTPAIGFDVPGLRDSVVDGETGVLVRSEGQFASAWASLALDHRTREALGAAARERALRLHWSAAVEGFAKVADEAIARAGAPHSRSPAPSAPASRSPPPAALASRSEGPDFHDRGSWRQLFGRNPPRSWNCPRRVGHAGCRGRAMPAVTTAGAPGGLREFYENPDTPASSGPDRAARQARMLGQALDGVPGPAVHRGRGLRRRRRRPCSRRSGTPGTG